MSTVSVDGIVDGIKGGVRVDFDCRTYFGRGLFPLQICANHFGKALTLHIFCVVSNNDPRAG